MVAIVIANSSLEMPVMKLHRFCEFCDRCSTFVLVWIDQTCFELWGMNMHLLEVELKAKLGFASVS